MGNITPRQKELLIIIYNYIKNEGYAPTFEQMREELKVISNQSVIDLLNKLEKSKLIKRSSSIARSISILPLGYKILNVPFLAQYLGVTTAGVAINSVEVSGEWQELSADVSKLSGDVFILKISGDSMINAGINNGDMVLVKSEKEYVSGNVVLAQIGDEATVKRFVSEDRPPYIYLKPENPEYKIIPFTDEVELKGKVISVLKEGYWRSLS